MNKLLEIVVGLILLLLPIYMWIVNSWGLGDAAVMVFKGLLVWVLIFVGLLFIALGINDLRE